MKLRHFSQNQQTRLGHRGMTLIELMVAVGVGSVVLMVVCTVFMSSNRSFAHLGNYVGIDQVSQQALERMTRDIRNSQDLLTYATNRIVLQYDGTTNLTFAYYPGARQLIRSMTGQPDTVLLKDCDSLDFSLYKNAPLGGGTMGTTADPALGKCIRVTWKCSRSVLGQTRDTEYVEQALIVIRNKPIL